MASGPTEEPEQIRLMKQLVAMAARRTRWAGKRTRWARQTTKLARERTELSAERSYMNAERTLSVWVRTALAIMVFGIAVDRFDLLLYQWPDAAAKIGRDLHAASTWVGIALVALGVVIAAATGIRFLAYAAEYHRQGHRAPYHHGPFLAPAFALLTVLFGLMLLALMLIVFL